MEQKHKEMIAQPQNMQGEDNEVEIDLLELLYHIMDHWKLVAACFLVCAVLAGVITKFFMKPEYEATAKMYVLSSSDSVVNLSDLQLGSYLASDYQEVFMTHEVTNAVISNLNLSYTYEEMQDMLTITNPSGTRILHITIKLTDPEEAAKIANEFLEVASQYVADVMITDRPTVLSTALVPDEPIGPSTIMNTMIGAMIGIVLPCAYLVIVFLLDDKVKSGDDITKVTGMPILAEVPVFAVKHGEIEEKTVSRARG